jgi:hypothetical protein
VPLRKRHLGREIILSTILLALTARRFGWRSRPVLGAIGGLLPDVEHLLWAASKHRYRMVFPTHLLRGRFHNLFGRRRLPDVVQTVLAIGVLFVTVLT